MSWKKPMTSQPSAFTQSTPTTIVDLPLVRPPSRRWTTWEPPPSWGWRCGPSPLWSALSSFPLSTFSSPPSSSLFHRHELDDADLLPVAELAPACRAPPRHHQRASHQWRQPFCSRGVEPPNFEVQWGFQIWRLGDCLATLVISMPALSLMRSRWQWRLRRKRACRMG